MNIKKHEDSELIGLYNQGKTCREIDELLGVCKGYTRHRLTNAGVQLPDLRNGKKTKEEAEEIIQKHREGLTVPEIVKVTKQTPTYVRKTLKNNGLVFNKCDKTKMNVKRATEDEILQKHFEGLTILEIKDFFGYKTPSHVADVIKRNGYRCNKCYKDEDKIRELRALGLGYREIGRELGRDYKGIAKLCKRLGLGLSPEEKKQICERSRRHVDWAEKVEKATQGAFTLVSQKNIQGGESILTIKCVVCGATRETKSITVREHLNREFEFLPCLECTDKIRKEKERAEKEQKQYEQQQRELQRFINKKRVQVQMPFCKCGQLLEKGRNLCDDCRHQSTRAAEKRHELKRMRRIKTFGRIDKDITLERLYDRDAGVCYICGCSCDWNDYTRNDKGAFIVGATYPTIEHVKPLSKGGGHVWENVRLACWTCNVQKSDKELAAV